MGDDNKRCTRCGETKALSEFSKDRRARDGLCNRCSGCNRAYRDAHRDESRAYSRAYHAKYRNGRNAYSRAWHAKHRAEDLAYARAWYAEHAAERITYQREWNAANPEKAAAKDAVNHAIAAGRLVRGTECESCGSTENIHGHHDDYGKPLDVRWLCASCHKRHHVALRREVAA